MFAVITCPACEHKLTIPEGNMGNRQTCPNCHSIFAAGKSAVEAADARAKSVVAAAAGYNKTMLGQTGPPIRYNCPRCNKPLESPTIEAGTKKPCPECGQRLQVPAAPPAQPGLNKTILAVGDGAGSRPSSGLLSSETPGAASASMAAAQPAWLPKTGPQWALAIGGTVIAALVLLNLLTGPSSAEREKYASAQRELEKLKADMEQKRIDMERQNQFEAEKKRYWEKIEAENKIRQDKLDYERELDRNNQRYRDDKNAAAQAKLERDREQRKIDQARVEAEQKRRQDELELKAKYEASQRELAAANQRATTIIHQAPPPVYYPWHPRYYWGW